MMVLPSSITSRKTSAGVSFAARLVRAREEAILTNRIVAATTPEALVLLGTHTGKALAPVLARA
jgi:hypothetical protein